MNPTVSKYSTGIPDESFPGCPVTSRVAKSLFSGCIFASPVKALISVVLPATVQKIKEICTWHLLLDLTIMKGACTKQDQRFHEITVTGHSQDFAHQTLSKCLTV